jgi:hypothetical protein
LDRLNTRRLRRLRFSTTSRRDATRRDEAQSLSSFIEPLDETADIATGDLVVVAEFRHCGFRFKPAGYSDLKPATIPE